VEHAAKFTSWPAPQTQDSSGGGQAKRAIGPERHTSNLSDSCQLSSWPTPLTKGSKSAASSDERQSMRTQQTRGKPMNETALLASWGTPLTNHANDTPENFLRRKKDSVDRGTSMGVS
jgi:hypothetical protein